MKILNSLSSDLDIMRPSLLETGLESIVYNLNRKNNDLLFFEFGNTYSTPEVGNYIETEHLCLYISGNKNEFSWKQKPAKTDFYFLKGTCQNIFNLCGLNNVKYKISKNNNLESSLSVSIDGEIIGEIGVVDKSILQKFDVKQQVLFADIYWKSVLQFSKMTTVYTEIPKFPAVHRDLSIVVNKNASYSQIEEIVKKLNIPDLKV